MTSTQNVHEAPKTPARIAEHVREPSAARRANHTPKRTTCKSATQAWSTGAPHVYVCKNVRGPSAARRARCTPIGTDCQSASDTWSTVHHISTSVQNCPRAERSEASEAYADTNGCEAPITMLVPGFSYNSISLLTGTQTLRN